MIQVKYKYIFLCDFQFFLISTFALNNRKFEDLKIKRERKYMSEKIGRKRSSRLVRVRARRRSYNFPVVPVRGFESRHEEKHFPSKLERG